MRLRRVAPAGGRPADARAFAPPSRVALFLRRAMVQFSERPVLRHAELLLFVLVLAAAGVYGSVRGGQAEVLLAALHDAGDAVARTAGFGIDQVEIRGLRQFGREDVLRQAGVTEHSSLLLLNAERARAQLRAVSWIGDATVRKLYPNRLDITIEERAPFARWQRDGKLHLIARDGQVLESGIGLQRSDLPLVVGIGAEKKAAALLELLERFPAIRAEVRAGVLVAERRWNLRLNNGIDVRLPEEDPALALERLVALDRTKQILTRDVTMIDLRAPERVAVRLSDEAEKARAERKRLPKRTGADS